MPISIARRIAYEVLTRVESQHAFAGDLLHSALTPKISTADAALATELSLGVLRQQRLLDFLIERQSRKRIASLDREVVIALRLGIYQLRFLDRVPARAAIFESVELIKRSHKKSAATFVNAVLRGAAEIARADIASLLPQNPPLAERLGILHSHPTWLVERWLSRYGEEKTTSLLEANNRAPEIIAAVQDPSKREEVIRQFTSAGLQIERGRWLTTCFKVRGGSLTQSAPYRSGAISIQDEASQMVPLLLDVHPHDSVLDLCAAPGGKTAILARAAGPTALIVAADRHAHRLAALRANFRRLNLRHVHIVELDGTHALPFRHQFTRILVDAPCSGTGTLARNPEIRWTLRPEDLPQLHARQTALLRAALAQLAPEGRLVYSTCSLEPEENESVVEEVLHETKLFRKASVGAGFSRPDFHQSSETAPQLPLIDDAGFFRTFPPTHHTDGFFAVAIEHA